MWQLRRSWWSPYATPGRKAINPHDIKCEIWPSDYWCPLPRLSSSFRFYFWAHGRKLNDVINSISCTCPRGYTTPAYPLHPVCDWGRRHCLFPGCLAAAALNSFSGKPSQHWFCTDKDWRNETIGVSADPWDTLSLQAKLWVWHLWTDNPCDVLARCPRSRTKQQQGLSVEWRQEMGHVGFFCRLVERAEVIFTKKNTGWEIQACDGPVPGRDSEA